jgi:putative ABC transport system ATP-binding protein
LALQLSQLRKSYVAPDGSRLPVVSIDHFSLAAAEQAALVGSSGCGKTTLLHLIAGILAPDSGRVLIDTGAGAVDIASLPEASRDVFRGRYIGYIFQTHHLLSGFTALENVLLGMSFTGRSPDRSWAESLLSEVGLGDRLHYKPRKLSVGQQQRVAVARALANRPRLVLADEPTGALDVKNAEQVLDLIRRLCSQVGAALLMVSHDPAVTSQFPRVLSLAELNQPATAAAATPALSTA